MCILCLGTLYVSLPFPPILMEQASALVVCTHACHHDTWHHVTRNMYTLAQIENSNHLMNKITTASEPLGVRDVAYRLAVRLEAIETLFQIYTFLDRRHSEKILHESQGVTFKSKQL